MDRSIRHNSQFEVDTFWDAQPVKADEYRVPRSWTGDRKGPVPGSVQPVMRHCKVVLTG